MRDLVLNQAKTTLQSSIGATDTSFTVASGTATRFPNPSTTVPGNLIVAIDNELVLCSGYSGDTFTVLTRGYDGTSVASHTASAYVQQVMTAKYITHLWQNVPDHFVLDVPPSARNSTQGTYDDEFETNSGNWTIYPSDSGMSLSYGTALASWLLFKRLTAQSTSYYFYRAFAPTGAFTATCRLSHAGTLLGTSNSAYATFFIADQANPTSSVTSGNRSLVAVGMDTAYRQPVTSVNTSSTIQTPLLSLQQYASASGIITGTTNILMAAQGALYFQIQYDGTSTWTQRFSSDGITFYLLGQYSQTFTPASLGWVFQASGTPISQQAALDWLRVTIP